jgi:Flp pilus assembly pilin Flp
MRTCRGQSTSEYFIILVVVLVAVLAAGFRDKIKNAFSSYYNKASQAITAMNP